MTSLNYIRQVGWNCIDIDTIPNEPLFTNGLRHHTWTVRFIIDPERPRKSSQSIAVMIGLTVRYNSA